MLCNLCREKLSQAVDVTMLNQVSDTYFDRAIAIDWTIDQASEEELSGEFKTFVQGLFLRKVNIRRIMVNRYIILT